MRARPEERGASDQPESEPLAHQAASCVNALEWHNDDRARRGMPMAAHANSLTERVTTPARAGTAAPVEHAGDGRPRLRDGLSAGSGTTLASLITSAGLDAIRSRRSGCACLVRTRRERLIADAQRTRFTPNLALEVARMTPIGAYPLLDYLVLTSETRRLRRAACSRGTCGSSAIRSTIEIREVDDVIRVEMGCVICALQRRVSRRR